MSIPYRVATFVPPHTDRPPKRPAEHDEERHRDTDRSRTHGFENAEQKRLMVSGEIGPRDVQRGAVIRHELRRRQVKDPLEHRPHRQVGTAAYSGR